MRNDRMCFQRASLYQLLGTLEYYNAHEWHYSLLNKLHKQLQFNHRMPLETTMEMSILIANQCVERIAYCKTTCRTKYYYNIVRKWVMAEWLTYRPPLRVAKR